MYVRWGLWKCLSYNIDRKLCRQPEKRFSDSIYEIQRWADLHKVYDSSTIWRFGICTFKTNWKAILIVSCSPTSDCAVKPALSHSWYCALYYMLPNSDFCNMREHIGSGKWKTLCKRKVKNLLTVLFKQPPSASLNSTSAAAEVHR